MIFVVLKNEWMFVMWMLIWTSLEFSENLFPSNESRVGFHLSCCCYSCVAAKHLEKLARGFLVFVRCKIMETLRAELQLRNALKYPFFSQSWHFRPCLFMVRGFRDFELKYQAFCGWYLILFISSLDLLLVWQLRNIVEIFCGWVSVDGVQVQYNIQRPKS